MGDSGETSLVGGKKVSKSSSRVEAYGDVDELNSVIGIARFQTKDGEIRSLLKGIQNDLFIMGGDLATELDGEFKIPRISPGMTKKLELLIDRFHDEVGDLREFILPSGFGGGAYLHLARAVCRRAERKVVALSEKEKLNAQNIVYLNRLSDLLFTLARVENKRNKFEEILVDFTKLDEEV